MSKLVRSFSYAFNGIKTCFVKEANFRIHVFIGVIVVIAGIYFNISAVEWILVLICMMFVFVMEMINSALEKLCDVVHKEIHPGIKITKDIAAGAVLLSAIFASICGAIIFFPKIILIIKSMNPS